MSCAMSCCVAVPQVEPQRSIAHLRLPCAGLPSICALQHPAGNGNGTAFEGGGGASSGLSDMATLPEEAEEVREQELL